MAQIYEFGTANVAAQLGYAMKGCVRDTAEKLLAKHRDEDLIFVQGPSIFGEQELFEFARFEPVEILHCESKVMEKLTLPGDRVQFLNQRINRDIAELRRLTEEVMSIQYAEGLTLEIRPQSEGGKVAVYYRGMGCITADFNDAGLAVNVFSADELTPFRELTVMAEDGRFKLPIYQNVMPPTQNVDAIELSGEGKDVELKETRDPVQKSVTCYFDVDATSDFGDSPSHACWVLTSKMLSEIQRMRDICVTEEYSEIRSYGAPDNWMPSNLAQDIRVQGEEMCVTNQSFWFVGFPKNEDYAVETSGVDIDELFGRWHAAESGATIKFVDDEIGLEEMLEEEIAKLPLAEV